MEHHGHSSAGAVDRLGQPRVVEARHALSMVYGGGAVFGIGYCAGVAHGLAAAGLPVASAPSLGTSAGSWAASAVALGLEYDDMADVRVPRVPSSRYGVLAKIARSIFGDATHPLVAVSAVHVRSRRRHILDGGRYPLADLVAASSAVPGVLPPHRVDGRLYVDGGVWSPTSVDAASPAEQVIVVAPLAGRAMGALGVPGFLLEREVRSWRRRNPEHEVTVIKPNREIARLAGRNPMGLFEAERGRAVYPLAYEQGARWGERLLERAAAA